MAKKPTALTPQADTPATADPAPAPSSQYVVAALPKRGFYRAGRHWPRAGVEVSRDELTDAQWLAIESEPMLTVVAL